MGAGGEAAGGEAAGGEAAGLDAVPSRAWQHHHGQSWRRHLVRGALRAARNNRGRPKRL